MSYSFLQAHPIHDHFFHSQNFDFSEVILVYYEANLDVLFVTMKCYTLCCFIMK